MTYKDVDPIFTATIFDVQWSNTPEPVVEEVKQLWQDLELGNDTHYWAWDGEEWDDYPLIREYLQSRGINTCLIHYWW